MSKKVLFVVFSLLSVVLIISGFSLHFVEGYQQDKVYTLATKNVIDTEYQTICFLLENARIQISSMQNYFDLYYEKVVDYKDYYLQILQDIDATKVQISELYQKFEQNCIMATRGESKIKCSNIQQNYDYFNAAYQNLQLTYQEFMKGYEDWQKDTAY